MNLTTTGSSKNILVIRLSAMGDVAMTVPVVRCLVQQNPNVKVTILSRSFFKAFFTDIPNVAFIEAQVSGRHKGVLGLFKLSRELKKLGFDGVADLHDVLRSNILKFFFKLYFMKVAQVDKGREGKKALTSGNQNTFKQLRSTHERYADVFRKLGFTIDLSKHKFPERKPLNNKIQQLVGADAKKWVGIAPFAQYASKSYPLERLLKVIGRLSAGNDYTLLLFGGGKKEGAILNNIQSKYSNTVNIVGKLSFEEELQLISNLDLMLSMDSGNAHIAAMYGVKVVTLWGVTHPYAGFYPFGQDPENALLADRSKYPLIPTSVYGNKFPSGYENAIASIDPDEVVKKIESILME